MKGISTRCASIHHGYQSVTTNHIRTSSSGYFGSFVSKFLGGGDQQKKDDLADTTKPVTSQQSASSVQQSSIREETVTSKSSFAASNSHAVEGGHDVDSSIFYPPVLSGVGSVNKGGNGGDVEGGGSSDVVTTSNSPTHSAFGNDGSELVSAPSHLIPPTPIAHFRSPDAILAQRAVDYVAKRREKLFEEMIVYNGGTVDDKETLGEHMIMRNFFHFGMYHKKWGFYPRQFRKYRDLVTSGFFDPIPFANLRSQTDYDHYVAKINESNPVFISPTQLFQPYYGWVFAEYVMGVVRAKFAPGEPLVLYDIGAGTGAFAESFLNYLAEFHPHFYDVCEYHLIEVSPSLVQLQRTRLVHHFHKVRIHNCSILNWKERENRRCMVIGIELLSTMPHDHVVWLADGACYEHWVTMVHPDNLSTANERHLQLRDPAILRYLRYLDWMREDTQHALRVLCQTGGRENIDVLKYDTIEPTPYDSSTLIANKIVHMNNPYRQAYLPTASMMMIEVLAEFFPRHHALFADWSDFTENINGINGPIIQTKKRIGKDMYIRRCSAKFNENLGMMDVCFPTDFQHFKKVYLRLFGNKSKEVSIMTHPDFWATFGGDKTAIYTTKSGYNPLVQDFKNFKVFSSHHVDGVDVGIDDEH